MGSLLFKGLTHHFSEEQLSFLWGSQGGFLVVVVLVLEGEVPCVWDDKRGEGFLSGEGPATGSRPLDTHMRVPPSPSPF